MLRLFSANGCPYAQRTRALLRFLDLPFELREIDLRNKPADFLALSPTGKVPLLVDGDATLYESAVINEYLRERAGWDEGFSAAPYQRARERLAMLQFDNVLAPAFWTALKAQGALDEAQLGNVERELDELAATVWSSDARVNLLAFHVITHVVRWRWLGSATPLPALLAARPALDSWLDEVAARPEVRQTLPPEADTVALLRRFAGLAA